MGQRPHCVYNPGPLFSTTLSTDEWPSATKLISLEIENYHVILVK